MQIQRTPSSFSAGCISLFGLPFFLAGLFVSGLYFNGYVKWWAAQSWEEVPCWIDSVELETSNNHSTSRKTTAVYRYRYQGRIHQGSQVSFGSGSDNVGRFQIQIYQELKRYADSKGAKSGSLSDLDDKKPFRCFVNPSRPESAVLYRSLRWEMQAFLAVFALTFPAVGASLVAGGMVGAGNQRRESQLRKQHPDQPWKWKPAWSGGSIPEDSGFVRTGLLAYTIWSGLVILPLAGSIALGGFIKEPKAVLVALVFLGLWSIPAWFALRHLRQRAAVGAVHFEPSDSPVQPGGELNGSIVFERPLSMKADAEVKLECRKQVIHSGGSEGRTTTMETIWSRSERIPVDMGAGVPFACRIPVRFTLPRDAPESAFGGSLDPQYGWRLVLEIVELNIHASFEIPVCRTGSAPVVEAGSEARVPSILDTASVDLPGLLARRRIRAVFNASGMPVSVVCPPARNPALIGFLALFNTIWTGVSVFLILREAPLLLRTVWPCSAVLLWGFLLWNLLHKRTATFGDTGVTVVNALGPLRWVRAFQKTGISGFISAVHMTSGTNSFYRVQLATVLGKRETLVDGITESTTAEALVGRLGLWRESGAVAG